MNATVEISGTATYTLQKLAEGVTNRRPLNAALGKRGEVELREHFRKRNQEPNKKGWPAQNFWERIRTATALSAFDESGATVTINDPAFAGKLADPTITPKEGKYLALPAIAAAYGKSARSFNNLEPMIRWINGSRRAVALMERRATDVKTKGESGGTVFYWLVESVRAKKDPKALPERDKFEGALVDEAREFVADLIR
jgi:hypothetical protein